MMGHNFTILYSCAYVERDEDERFPDRVRDETRPHLIGLNDRATKFLIACRSNRLLYPIFGPLYVGGLGSCLDEGVLKPSLRFKPDTLAYNLKIILEHVETVYQNWGK